MTTLQAGDLGKAAAGTAVDNAQLRDVNEAVRSHPIGNRRSQTAWLHDRHETYRRCGLIFRKVKNTKPAVMPAFLCLRRREQLPFKAAPDRVFGVGDPQLTHRIADVKLHRAGFDPQDQRDLMVGFALAGPVEDFPFARREPVCPARLGAGQGQSVLVGIDQYHLQAGPLVFHQLPQIGVIGCRGADRQDRQVVVVIVQNKAAAVHDVVFPRLAEDLPVMPILGGDGGCRAT